MVCIQRKDDGGFWCDSFESLTSGTGHTTRNRTKFPHAWTSDRSRAREFTLEDADVRAKYLKRYYGIETAFIAK